MEIELNKLWAKTDAEGQPALSVRDHCLNVGAVGEFILQILPPFLRKLFPRQSAILIALHDIGKISPGFQLKSSKWKLECQEFLKLGASDSYEPKHAIVSQLILARRLPRVSNWLIAVGGHHGNYPTHRARPRGDACRAHNHPDWAEKAREKLIAELTQFFGPLRDESVDKGPHLHLLTGFIIFSDWIGSNTEWFPLNEKTPVTIETARKRARGSVVKIGWSQRSVQPGLNFPKLFAKNGAPRFEPRPLQKTLLSAIDMPGLYIVEAPMGCGKTEAALASAYRRWDEGDESGLYFALPTQLTSNRINERVLTFLSNVVSDQTSIALVHGAAWLSDGRISSIYPTFSDPEERKEANESNRWFSDNRKALLAPFGVGTIDQALMATMATRFSALRLFALSGKVIVIDEVHSYDPYTSALVDEAVKWLLQCGCTIIILSATLTACRRAGLVAAAGAKECKISSAYPLVTKLAKDSGTACIHLVSEPKTDGIEVQIENIAVDSREWIIRAAEAAETGACVLIVRNTVALAQETYRLLKTECSERVESFGLIHSRFPQFRRNENEKDWMQKLGKGNKFRPKGAILVGTQVVEQSVDIDADLLITDLAPTDLILQRIGRLHRHQRQRPTGFDKPVCCILQPQVDWEQDGKGTKQALGPSAYVYPPFTLFQAQRIWKKRSAIQLPDSLRNLLETSEAIPPKLPSGAQALLNELREKTRKMRLQAKAQNIFSRNPTLDDIEGLKTRWGSQPSAYIVLLSESPVYQDGRIKIEFTSGQKCSFTRGPFNFEIAHALNLNAIRVPAYVLPKPNQNSNYFDWVDQHLSSSALFLCKKDSTECRPLDSSESESYRISYHPEIGLSYERIDSSPSQFSKWEEDFWF